MIRKLSDFFWAVLHHKWTILGDKGNVDWMEKIQSCRLPFKSWYVLKDGLAVHWEDGEWLAIQGKERVTRFVIKGNWHCREKDPDCAFLTTTGKSCYQIMLEAYEKSRSGIITPGKADH